jgi:hypothetical protein
MIGYAPSVCCGEQKYRKRVWEGSGQARLPDAGFTGEQNNLSFARLCFGTAPMEQLNLFLSPHKLREATCV